MQQIHVPVAGPTGAAAAPPERLAAVVVNYRTAEDTMRAVSALRASRHPPDGIVVVDNGSGDDSVPRLRHLPELTLLESPRNLGFAGGSNLGIRAALDAGATLVVLVNSDALVSVDCIGTLADALHTAPRAGIAGPVIVDAAEPTLVSSAGIRFAPRSGRVQTEAFGRWRDAVAPAVRTVDAVSGAVMMIRREVFERLGLLDDAYFFSFEDVDFCLRARAAGFTTLCVGTATARHVGSRTIGRRAPDKLYFATRNHLRLADRVAPMSRRPGRLLRALAIVVLNLAYAAIRTEAPRGQALAAVLRGACDHARGRYGEGVRG